MHPDGTLAGSRLLLDGMVAGAVRHGIPLAVALRAATENPARLLGLADRGRLEPGLRADLVVVSRVGRLRRVLGRPSPRHGPAAPGGLAGGRTLPEPLGYLPEPLTRPRTRWRWARIPKASTGTSTMVPAAAMRPQ